ncbi:MAG: glycosyl transferase family 1 [Ardenticatenaceae bacterium]|nr:MAG: glycosyl transferase family 1 [Ardenticatenaceae bacterium]
MRIAFFTPISPIKSAISDYSEGLAVAFAHSPDVSTLHIFTSGTYEAENPVIREKLTILPHTAFNHADYDVTVYALGDNAQFHEYMLSYIYRYPGVVILHDLTLHRLILTTTVGRQNPKAYIDQLAYAYDADAAHIAQYVNTEVNNEVLLKYPLFERIVDSSLGTIVHNHYARNQILLKRPSALVQTIVSPFFLPPGFPPAEPSAIRKQQRASLKLDADDFVVGSFGIFVPNKHLHACLAAFKEVAQQKQNAHYLLCGFAADGYDLAGEIRQMGLENQVHLTGWQPPTAFVRNMFALDVGIHLRYPHIGGTPYTPIRLMGLGIATITSDIEPLQELPQGTCLKIAPDDYAEAMLTALLNQLALDDSFRSLVAENGRSFIQQHHQLNAIARQYVQFFQSIV